MPLRRSLRQVGERIAEFYAAGGGEAPYLLYVYSPADEFQVRRELGDLRAWLEEQAVRCVAISLADLFWEALADHGWLETIFEEERRAAGDPAALEEIHRSVAEILHQPPTLPDRVVAALDNLDGRSAAFLYRAGALYPAYRTSALLDDLRHRVRRPVTLLYPGGVEGNFGLRFMNRCEPAYGYRATIIPRGGDA